MLRTKLYIPPVHPSQVTRPRLVERLNAGLALKFTLVSAPAGSGKTNLVSTRAANCGWPVAWLSLEDSDNEPLLFMEYMIAAMQTIVPDIGESVLPWSVGVE